MWTWDHPQQAPFKKLKEAVSITPILRYFNLNEEVTLQCDPSQCMLVAALLQGGQPVVYASRALTATEMQYAQIEKEPLAIVCMRSFRSLCLGIKTTFLKNGGTGHGIP